MDKIKTAATGAPKILDDNFVTPEIPIPENSAHQEPPNPDYPDINRVVIGEEEFVNEDPQNVSETESQAEEESINMAVFFSRHESLGDLSEVYYDIQAEAAANPDWEADLAQAALECLDEREQQTRQHDQELSGFLKKAERFAASMDAKNIMRTLGLTLVGGVAGLPIGVYLAEKNLQKREKTAEENARKEQEQKSINAEKQVEIDEGFNLSKIKAMARRYGLPHIEKRKIMVPAAGGLLQEQEIEETINPEYPPHVKEFFKQHEIPSDVRDELLAELYVGQTTSPQPQIERPPVIPEVTEQTDNQQEESATAQRFGNLEVDQFAENADLADHSVNDTDIPAHEDNTTAQNSHQSVSEQPQNPLAQQEHSKQQTTTTGEEEKTEQPIQKEKAKLPESLAGKTIEEWDKLAKTQNKNYKPGYFRATLEESTPVEINSFIKNVLNKREEKKQFPDAIFENGISNPDTSSLSDWFTYTAIRKPKTEPNKEGV